MEGDINHGKGVIPAPYQVWGNSSRNQGKHWIPDQVRNDKRIKLF